MKLVIPVLFVLLFASCTTSYNARTIKENILIEEGNMQDLSVRIESINSQRISKVAEGKLDETTDSVALKYIQQLKDSVNTRLSFFKVIMSEHKSHKNRKATAAYLAVIKQQYAKELSNIIFLDDLFKASTFNRLNTAAYFGTGEYKLSDTATAQASLVMEKIIKDAYDFSARHPDRKLKAMFIVLGYADEQDISEGSPLYYELQPAAGANAGRKQLNTELSNRRASSIKSILKDKYQVTFPIKEGNMFSSCFVATGKGEALPLGTVKDFQPVDERRRVVLLYWSILPDLN